MMSLNSIDDETGDSNAGNDGRNCNITNCTTLNTSATVEISDSTSESINLGDDHITAIQENTEQIILKHEPNSRKRKNKSYCGLEEIESKYLIGTNEKVKQSRMEHDYEIDDTKISIADVTPSNHVQGPDDKSQNLTQFSDLPGCLATINCKSCHFKAVSKQQLKFHLFKAHLRGYYSVYFRCKICRFKTNNEDSMVLHQNDHENNADIQGFASDISRNNNVDIDILSKQFKLNVEDCQEIEWLESIKNLGSGVFQCFDCQYVSNKRESLQNHVLRHENSDFTCDEHPSLTNGCLKCIYKCCLLMLPYKVQECYKCGFRTCNNVHYMRHKNRLKDCTDKQKPKVQESAKKNQNDSHTNKNLKCYHCLYLTDSKDSLKLHAVKHYKQEFNCNLHPLEVDNTCTKCIYETVLVELTVEEVYSCQFCNFKTLKKPEFSQHQNSIGSCRNIQTMNLCSDTSEDEKCILKDPVAISDI